MTDPRYRGWDHPVTETYPVYVESERDDQLWSNGYYHGRRAEAERWRHGYVKAGYVPRHGGRPAPALVLALVVGGLVVAGIVLVRVGWLR